MDRATNAELKNIIAEQQKAAQEQNEKYNNLAKKAISCKSSQILVLKMKLETISITCRNQCTGRKKSYSVHQFLDIC